MVGYVIGLMYLQCCPIVPLMLPHCTSDAILEAVTSEAAFFLKICIFQKNVVPLQSK